MFIYSVKEKLGGIIVFFTVLVLGFSLKDSQSFFKFYFLLAIGFSFLAAQVLVSLASRKILLHRPVSRFGVLASSCFLVPDIAML